MCKKDYLALSWMNLEVVWEIQIDEGNIFLIPWMIRSNTMSNDPAII